MEEPRVAISVPSKFGVSVLFLYVLFFSVLFCSVAVSFCDGLGVESEEKILTQTGAECPYPYTCHDPFYFPWANGPYIGQV